MHIAGQAVLVVSAVVVYWWGAGHNMGNFVNKLRGLVSGNAEGRSSDGGGGSTAGDGGESGCTAGTDGVTDLQVAAETWITDISCGLDLANRYMEAIAFI